MLKDIANNEYLEYGSHEGAMYGTKLDTIRCAEPARKAGSHPVGQPLGSTQAKANEPSFLVAHDEVTLLCHFVCLGSTYVLYSV